MRRLFAKAGVAMRSLWWGVRQASGDAAYENYLRRAGLDGGCGHSRHTHDGSVSRCDFYLESLRRRYSGISRCC